MSDLQRLQEDRALRDAARKMVKNDITTLRSDMQDKGLAARFATRMKEGAEGVVEETTDFAHNNPGRIGGLLTLGLGAALAWIFRNEVADLIDKVWQTGLIASEEADADIPPPNSNSDTGETS